MAKQPEWEAIVPLLLKDWWSTEEACHIFNGYVWKGQKGRLINIRTGEEIANFVDGAHDNTKDKWEEKIQDKYLEIWDLWNGTDHTRLSGIWKRVGSSSITIGDEWNKYYCINWAQTKQRFIELPWLQWADKEGLITDEGFQQMNKKISASLDETGSYIKEANKPKGPAEVVQIHSPGKDKTPSKRQEKSDLRIIGAMYDILRTEEGRKNFGSDNELIGYLEENYQGEGISRSSLLDRFSKAKKLIVHNKKKPPTK